MLICPSKYDRGDFQRIYFTWLALYYVVKRNLGRSVFNEIRDINSWGTWNTKGWKERKKREREREGEREKAVGIEVLATILLLGTQVLFLWKMLPIKKKWGRRNVVSCVTTSRKSYFTTLCYVFASRVPIRCHSNLETSLRQRNVARSARRRKHWRWRDWL